MHIHSYRHITAVFSEPRYSVHHRRMPWRWVCGRGYDECAWWTDRTDSIQPLIN